MTGITIEQVKLLYLKHCQRHLKRNMMLSLLLTACAIFVIYLLNGTIETNLIFALIGVWVVMFIEIIVKRYRIELGYFGNNEDEATELIMFIEKLKKSGK